MHDLMHGSLNTQALLDHLIKSFRRAISLSSACTSVLPKIGRAVMIAWSVGASSVTAVWRSTMLVTRRIAATSPIPAFHQNDSRIDTLNDNKPGIVHIATADIDIDMH